MKYNPYYLWFKMAVLAVVVSFAIVSCTPQPATPPEEEEEAPMLSVAIASIDFDWKYSEQSFEIVSEVPFVVFADVDWIITDNDTFTVPGRYILTVAALENPDEEIREGILYLTPEEGEQVAIPVMQFENQAPEVFEVSTLGFELDSFKQTVYLGVNSAVPFSAVTVADWITVSEEEQKPSSDFQLPIVVERNMTPEERRAKVSVMSTDNRKWIDVTITQAPFQAVMSVSVDSLSIDGNRGVVSFMVSSDIDFVVSCEDEWAAPEKADAYAGGSVQHVNINVERNGSMLERKTLININSVEEGVLSYVVVLTQGQKIASIDNEITEISLLKKLNPGLDKDYVMTPDENGVFSCYIPGKLGAPYSYVEQFGYRAEFPTFYPIDIENMVVSFKTNADQVYVNNTALESGKSKCDLSTNATFKAVSESGEVRNYVVDLTYFTGLPIVFIDLESGREVASKEVYEYGTVKIVGADDFEGLEEQEFEIHGRGNSSWGTFRKKPSYTFKLDKAEEVLGMPAHKKWVMIGNYRDKTLLRNSVAWWLSERLPALAWTPRYRQVEVVLNGTHRGVYQLTEQVRIDKNRVNIAEMLPTDTQGEAITGGYIVEFHYGSDSGQWCWDMPYLRGGSGASVKVPKIEDSNEAQRDYIMNYVMTIDNWFASGENIPELMEKYIDMPSWAAQWLVFELSGTTEPQGPNSWYTYKQRGDDKWYCGPAWDFDYRSYIPSRASNWENFNALYMPEMCRYRPFEQELVSQWRTYIEPLLPELLQYIEDQRDYLRLSAEANWNLHEKNLLEDGRRENGDEQIPWDSALDRMIQYLELKWDFVSKNITNL